MNQSDFYPMLLKPVFKDYIWGGSRIAEAKKEPSATKIAESWEVSDREGSQNLILNGAFQGRLLSDICTSYGAQIIGTAARDNRMPLLIKILDAAEPLSVQVHPSNDTATLSTSEPKTEMWYVLDALPGSKIYAGLKPGVDKDSFVAAVNGSGLEDMLVAYDVSQGDVFYIQGGMVHSLSKGCLVLEVQQNSDTTYRIYDWGRTDSNGHSRELHVAQALDVIEWKNKAPALVKQTSQNGVCDTLDVIVHSPFFTVARARVKKGLVLNQNKRSFRSIFTERGAITLSTNNDTVECPSFSSCLLPAAAGQCKIEPVEKEALVIIASLVLPISSDQKAL